MIRLLLYLFLALSISFLCSILEAVLLSSSESFLIVKIQEGNDWAKDFLDYKENVDKPLSAILTLNTIAHTIGAAGVGAQAIIVFGEAYFGIVSAILTILILVITEIIPKTIGTRYWSNLVLFSTKALHILVFITYPFIVISSIITRKLSNGNEENPTSREEIAALATIGSEEGLFQQKEHDIIQNLLRLKDVVVTDIMTPRVVLSIANEKLSLEDFFANKDFLKFSRIPVYSKIEENITGYIFRQEVFEKLAENQNELRLKDIKREIVLVPNVVVLFDLWETLLEKKEHIALIVDEYGGIEGIVTMEDIIETLLGLEIIDETDTVTDMQAFAKKRWEERLAKHHLINDNKTSSKKE